MYAIVRTGGRQFRARLSQVSGPGEFAAAVVISAIVIVLNIYLLYSIIAQGG